MRASLKDGWSKAKMEMHTVQYAGAVAMTTMTHPLRGSCPILPLPYGAIVPRPSERSEYRRPKTPMGGYRLVHHQSSPVPYRSACSWKVVLEESHEPIVLGEDTLGYLP